MAEFINTIDALGDEAVVDSIIDRTITEFKDDQITSIAENAFNGCIYLKTVDCPMVTSIVTNSFANSGVETIYAPMLTELKGSAFQQSKKLKRAVFPLLSGDVAWTFTGCSELEFADLGYVSVVRAGTFGNCAKLSVVILRRSTVALSEQGVFYNSGINKGTGYIYVPRNLIESYKSATNWSNYADRFRALEDYTVDGTVTGELDETKI